MNTRRGSRILTLALAAISAGVMIAGCNTNTTMSSEDLKKMQQKGGAMPPGAMNDIAKARTEFLKRHPEAAQAGSSAPSGPGAMPSTPGGTQ